ncbi:MAG: hypothetical protein CM15mP62_21030 [Rhodospirillaceae bacterium]|nr:MAG: hypothetical protein CM15mP62_21030 [Rhodospirillaceae bacterium]
MRSSKVIHVVSCHAEGEVGDVIVGELHHHRAKLFGSNGHGSKKITLT